MIDTVAVLWLVAKKYEELHPKKKTKEPKGEAPKKTEAKKEEKPKEPAPAPVKEKKDPFADLAPPKMVFDEWKKTYRNTDTLKVAIPWFWENIDKEGMYIWTNWILPENFWRKFCHVISFTGISS